MVVAQYPDRIMLKPVFIPRSHRQTIREQEEKEVKAAEIRDQNELLKKVHSFCSFLCEYY